MKLLILKAPHLAFIIKEHCDHCNIRPVTAVMALRDVFLCSGSLYVFRCKAKESAASNANCAA